MKTFAIILMCAGFVNFFSFMIAAEFLGGDATIGKTDGQHYYLGSHGHYTEVSRSVFDYSKFHKHSLAVTHPLIVVGAVLLVWQAKKKERTIQAA